MQNPIRIIALLMIIGLAHAVLSGAAGKGLSYAAPPGGGSRTPLAPPLDDGAGEDERATPPESELIYLPVDLGDKRCRMAKTADGFAGYLDIDGDDVEEKVRIAKTGSGVLLRGSFGGRLLMFDYDEALTPRTARLGDRRGIRTILDFRAGSVRLPGGKGAAEFMVIHDGYLTLLDKQRIALLEKNGVDASSLKPGDPAISTFASHREFQKKPDHETFTALSEKHDEVRENKAEIIKILGEKTYRDFEEKYFLYKTIAERNTGYIITISRRLDETFLDNPN